ncbi:MAG: desA1 [Patescibacteria group bacterium]|nr:desA1 [Patescibacteria group bacterium]
MGLSIQARMDEFFYKELLKYLKLAEEKRRWNVFKDIPWSEANPDTTDTLAHCVETFCAVEMYLPDFTSKLLTMIRRSRGRAWFHINWGYEESKHSMALEAWLLASGHRTEEQRKAFENELLEAEWELPFDHPRQMVAYTEIQELATFWNYRNLEKMAAKENDFALVTALRIISVDERVHYNFYKNALKEWLMMDPEGTIKDIKYVFDNFSMPGRSQIPRYDESARILAKTGIYGPREYIKLVKNPILEDLGIDKEFKLLEEYEEKYRTEREKVLAQMRREQIVVGNGHAVPKNTSPLNGKPTPFNSHALNGVLKNLHPGEEPPSQRPPLLEMIGIDAKKRNPSRSIILNSEAQEEKLPGSRGMDKYNDLDQKLMVIGDEISNNAEEMRTERAKIRRNRGKNSRLMKEQ